MPKKIIYLLSLSGLILVVALVSLYGGVKSPFKITPKAPVAVELKTTTLNVANYVPAQEPALLEAVTQIPGVAACIVTATANQVVIKYNPGLVSANVISGKLQKAGFPAQATSKNGALKIVECQIRYIP